jgi:hypothetical protein
MVNVNLILFMFFIPLLSEIYALTMPRFNPDSIISLAELTVHMSEDNLAELTVHMSEENLAELTVHM